MDILKKIITKFSIISVLNLCLLFPAVALIIPQTNTDSYDTNQFLGKWEMQTIVTESNCPYVFVGSTTTSNLEIKSTDLTTKSNSLKALWKGGKWSKSLSTVKMLNNKEAISERITTFTTKDSNNWKAILIDHLKLDEDDSIYSDTIVIQYKNGVPVGQYKTFSILTKAN